MPTSSSVSATTATGSPAQKPSPPHMQTSGQTKAPRSVAAGLDVPKAVATQGGHPSHAGAELTHVDDCSRSSRTADDTEARASGSGDIDGSDGDEQTTSQGPTHSGSGTSRSKRGDAYGPLSEKNLSVKAATVTMATAANTSKPQEGGGQVTALTVPGHGRQDSLSPQPSPTSRAHGTSAHFPLGMPHQGTDHSSIPFGGAEGGGSGGWTALRNNSGCASVSRSNNNTSLLRSPAFADQPLQATTFARRPSCASNNGRASIQEGPSGTAGEGASVHNPLIDDLLGDLNSTTASATRDPPALGFASPNNRGPRTRAGAAEEEENDPNNDSRKLLDYYYTAQIMGTAAGANGGGLGSPSTPGTGVARVWPGNRGRPTNASGPGQKYQPSGANTVSAAAAAAAAGSRGSLLGLSAYSLLAAANAGRSGSAAFVPGITGGVGGVDGGDNAGYANETVVLAMNAIKQASQSFVHTVKMHELECFFLGGENANAEKDRRVREAVERKSKQEVSALVLDLLDILEDVRVSRGKIQKLADGSGGRGNPFGSMGGGTSPFQELLERRLGSADYGDNLGMSMMSTMSTASLARPPVHETHKIRLKYDPLEKKKIINNYLVLANLGKGSYGKVKLGEDLKTKNKVAIKIIDKKHLQKKFGGIPSVEDNEDSGNTKHDAAPKGTGSAGGSGAVSASGETALKREIAIMKKIRHRNCVSLYEVIDDPSSQKLYLIMEYIPNGPVVKLKQSKIPLELIKNVEGNTRVNNVTYNRYLIRCCVRQQIIACHAAKDAAAKQSAGNAGQDKLITVDGDTPLTHREISGDDKSDRSSSIPALNSTARDGVHNLYSPPDDDFFLFSCKPMKEEIVCVFLRQLVSGLRYLHKKNVVHHDIKPDNILLGINNHVYLTDFGVSEILEKSERGAKPGLVSKGPDDDDVNQNGSNGQKAPRFGAGTLLFTAPELFSDDPEALYRVNPFLTDVWALGVTIYCVLMGVSPFNGKNYHEITHNIKHVRVPFNGSNIEGTPVAAEWKAVFDGLLEKDPKKRWSLGRIRSYLDTDPAMKRLYSNGIAYTMPSANGNDHDQEKDHDDEDDDAIGAKGSTTNNAAVTSAATGDAARGKGEKQQSSAPPAAAAVAAAPTTPGATATITTSARPSNDAAGKSTGGESAVTQPQKNLTESSPPTSTVSTNPSHSDLLPGSALMQTRPDTAAANPPRNFYDSSTDRVFITPAQGDVNEDEASGAKADGDPNSEDRNARGDSSRPAGALATASSSIAGLTTTNTTATETPKALKTNGSTSRVTSKNRGSVADSRHNRRSHPGRSGSSSSDTSSTQRTECPDTASSIDDATSHRSAKDSPATFSHTRNEGFPRRRRRSRERTMTQTSGDLSNDTSSSNEAVFPQTAAERVRDLTELDIENATRQEVVEVFTIFQKKHVLSDAAAEVVKDYVAKVRFRIRQRKRNAAMLVPTEELERQRLAQLPLGDSLGSGGSRGGRVLSLENSMEPTAEVDPNAASRRMLAAVEAAGGQDGGSFMVVGPGGRTVRPNQLTGTPGSSGGDEDDEKGKMIPLQVDSLEGARFSAEDVNANLVIPVIAIDGTFRRLDLSMVNEVNSQDVFYVPAATVAAAALGTLERNSLRSHADSRRFSFSPSDSTVGRRAAAFHSNGSSGSACHGGGGGGGGAFGAHPGKEEISIPTLTSGNGRSIMLAHPGARTPALLNGGTVLCSPVLATSGPHGSLSGAAVVPGGPTGSLPFSTESDARTRGNGFGTPSPECGEDDEGVRALNEMHDMDVDALDAVLSIVNLESGTDRSNSFSFSSSINTTKGTNRDDNETSQSKSRVSTLLSPATADTTGFAAIVAAESRGRAATSFSSAKETESGGVSKQGSAKEEKQSPVLLPAVGGAGLSAATMLRSAASTIGGSGTPSSRSPMGRVGCRVDGGDAGHASRSRRNSPARQTSSPSSKPSRPSTSMTPRPTSTYSSSRPQTRCLSFSSSAADTDHDTSMGTVGTTTGALGSGSGRPATQGGEPTFAAAGDSASAMPPHPFRRSHLPDASQQHASHRTTTNVPASAYTDRDDATTRDSVCSRATDMQTASPSGPSTRPSSGSGASRSGGHKHGSMYSLKRLLSTVTSRAKRSGGGGNSSNRAPTPVPQSTDMNSNHSSAVGKQVKSHSAGEAVGVAGASADTAGAFLRAVEQVDTLGLHTRTMPYTQMRQGRHLRSPGSESNTNSDYLCHARTDDGDNSSTSGIYSEDYTNGPLSRFSSPNHNLLRTVRPESRIGTPNALSTPDHLTPRPPPVRLPPTCVESRTGRSPGPRATLASASASPAPLNGFASATDGNRTHTGLERSLSRSSGTTQSSLIATKNPSTSSANGGSTTRLPWGGGQAPKHGPEHEEAARRERRARREEEKRLKKEQHKSRSRTTSPSTAGPNTPEDHIGIEPPTGDDEDDAFVSASEAEQRILSEHSAHSTSRRGGRPISSISSSARHPSSSTGANLNGAAGLPGEPMLPSTTADATSRRSASKNPARMKREKNRKLSRSVVTPVDRDETVAPGVADCYSERGFGMSIDTVSVGSGTSRNRSVDVLRRKVQVAHRMGTDAEPPTLHAWEQLRDGKHYSSFKFSRKDVR